jgi:acetyltransferase-like isoleucine patch superfamily enzyme
MKMSMVTIGPGASIGPRSVVLHDATVGEGATLDALSLAMKGESIPPATRWRGIPARSAM